MYFVFWMQTKVIKIDSDKVNIAKLKEAAAIVDSGGLVAFPTETVYGIACRVKNDSLKKLDELKGRCSGKYYTLHIDQKNEVSKFVPTISLTTQKLIKNAWPGPLTIVFNLNDDDLQKQQKSLNKEIFDNLYKDKSIGIRCPNNTIASTFLRLIHNPIVAPSANLTDQNPAIEPEQVLSEFSGKIDLIIDGGLCKHKKSSTVVKIGKNGLEILRPGVYSENELEKLSFIQFLFICTGNTCRSPMAEAIFSKYLAKKCECKVDDLAQRGYKVISAGIMGLIGAPASREAITACEAKGIDIKAHTSRKLTPQIIRDSDFIYAMEQIHCDYTNNLCPDINSKCELLAENQDIADPIGQSQGYFNNCAEQIEKAVKQRINELVI